MTLIKNDDNLVYSDPESNVATIGDMFEFIDGIEQTQDDLLSPNETRNLNEISEVLEMDDDIMREAQEMASKDPEAIARALDTIVRDMEKEYILTVDDLEIAKDNLATFHREVEDALQKGKPIPDNYMKTTEELMNNIKTQQEKLNNLTPLLEKERSRCLEYAERTKKDAKTKALPIKALALIFAFVKKTIQIFTRGLTDLGIMLHNKNQEFARGSRQAMRDVGDKAQAIYTKTQAKQQKLTLSFKKLYEKVVTKIKEMSQDMKIKRSLHKEIKAEKQAVKRIDNLTEKLARAAAKAKGLEPTDGKESLLKNAFYNYALDQARMRQSELIQAMKERYEAIPHLTYKLEDAIIASHKFGGATKDNLQTVQDMSWKEKDRYIDENFSHMSRDEINQIHKEAIMGLATIAEREGTYVKVESEYNKQNTPFYTRPEVLPKDIPASRSQELNQFDQMFKFLENPLLQEAFLSDLEAEREQPEQKVEKEQPEQKKEQSHEGYQRVTNLEEALNRARETVAKLNSMSHKNVEAPMIDDSLSR